MLRSVVATKRDVPEGGGPRGGAALRFLVPDASPLAGGASSGLRIVDSRKSEVEDFLFLENGNGKEMADDGMHDRYKTTGNERLLPTTGNEKRTIPLLICPTYIIGRAPSM